MSRTRILTGKGTVVAESTRPITKISAWPVATAPYAVEAASMGFQLQAAPLLEDYLMGMITNMIRRVLEMQGAENLQDLQQKRALRDQSVNNTRNGFTPMGDEERKRRAVAAVKKNIGHF